jgi:hypothetical protein
MRALLQRAASVAATVARRVTRTAAAAEGLAGAALVSFGVGVEFGHGWALIALGGVLMLAAWGRS